MHNTAETTLFVILQHGEKPRFLCPLSGELANVAGHYMSLNFSNLTSNRLLAALRLKEKKLILSHAEIVELVSDDILCEHHQQPRYVYFPLTGIISLVIALSDGTPLELTMVGSEGMLGATKILGVENAPFRAIVQAKGIAVRMTSDAFKELTQNGSQFQTVVKRYLFVLMAQLNRTAGCTHFHPVRARMARWLLMAHDRTDGDNFYLTQQSLSEMLGVHRSAVSIAASLLQTSGLINYSRGAISIMDRAGLEAASCSCYAALIEDQRQFYLD